MLGSEMAGNLKRKDIDLNGKLNSLLDVFTGAEAFLKDNEAKGYIVQKSDMRPRADGAEEEFLSFIEFHPYPLRQHESMPRLEFVTFDRAIDEFFSKLEAQKIEVKSVQQERMAMKKLQNVRKDHDQRLEALKTEQERDQRKATLVEMNEELVENALAVMRSAIANQIDWKEIQELIKEAKERRDPVASRITG
jgi:predicted ribosome quality control (RQC) complex YloA/Tae2 family protein